MDSSHKAKEVKPELYSKKPLTHQYNYYCAHCRRRKPLNYLYVKTNMGYITLIGGVIQYLHCTICGKMYAKRSWGIGECDLTHDEEGNITAEVVSVE